MLGAVYAAGMSVLARLFWGRLGRGLGIPQTIAGCRPRGRGLVVSCVVSFSSVGLWLRPVQECCMGCFGAIVCFSFSRVCWRPRWALWLVHLVLAWSVVGRSGTLLGRLLLLQHSVGQVNLCQIRNCGSFPVFGMRASALLLGSCHLVDVVSSHGLSLHFFSGLSVSHLFIDFQLPKCLFLAF